VERERGEQEKIDVRKRGEERRKRGEERRKRQVGRDAPELISNLKAFGHRANVLLARSRVMLQQVAHLTAVHAAARRLDGARIKVFDVVLLV